MMLGAEGNVIEGADGSDGSDTASHAEMGDKKVLEQTA